MRIDQWRRSLPRATLNLPLRSWLREKGSLTARLQADCTAFRVRLLCHGLQAPWLDEQEAGREKLPVREVLLECDGKPVIFAHTILSSRRGSRLNCWLAGLGSRSLGSLLFTHPGFQRGPLEYCRLDQRHPLYLRAAVHADVPQVLWARRSRHQFGRQAVTVTEVFLPGLLALGK
jgi:chorismate--pyruvate lyase